jgi:microcystin-dependent protein
MATKPENPSPIFNLPIFIPENWSNTTLNTTTTTSTTSTQIVGEIISYTGTSLPSSNWLWCDGTAYSPTTYSDLYNVIGLNYGSSSVANPATSSTSIGSDLAYSATSITKLSPTQTRSSITQNVWTIVIPSNNSGGGSFSITSPLYITNSGSFTPFGLGTLTISTNFNSITYSVYKDSVFFAGGTATPVSGGVNPFAFSVSNNSVTSNFTANSFIGNYTFSFTPAVQSTSSTYILRYTLGYVTSSSVSGGSTNWNNTAIPFINASSASGSTTCDNGGTLTITSATPSGYTPVAVTWTGNNLFLVPDLRSKTPVGSDATNIYTTTYEGTPQTTGGNKTMSANQLATHTHSISIAPTGSMLQSFTQNNAIQGIGAGSGDIVKTATYNQATYTGTAGNAGNSADLLPPFSVCNFLIRAN